MNKFILTFCCALAFTNSFSQTNTFPASGNVGIGTTSPRSALDVAKYIPSEALGVVFGRLSEGDTEGNGTFLGVQGYATNVIEGKSFSIIHNFYGQTNSSINFFRGEDKVGGFISFSTGSNAEKLRILSNGDVGIGTTDTKGYKLAVAGNMIAESVNVKLQSAWPDYVFAKSYALPSLQETEKQIQETGHLPGIPSATAVKAKGIDLGDMNAKLLQKIEQLTLYLIEMKKENAQQQKETQTQQEQINQLKQALSVITKALNKN